MYGQINKLFIIGNGFDLAHGLNTSYKNFIDSLWEKEKEKVFEEKYYIKIAGNCPYSFKSDLLTFNVPNIFINNPNYGIDKSIYGFDFFRKYLTSPKEMFHANDGMLYNIDINIKNIFLLHISEKKSLVNWVDIEGEYYSKLKNCLESIHTDDIKKLNLDFDNLRLLLKYYLSLEIKKELNPIPQIIEILKSILQPELVSGNQTLNKNDRIFFLNFNYTNTDKQYIDYFKNIIPQVINNINIHGELNNEDNPIIFGYGDELDEDHKRIENINNKQYLENEKSVNYAKTPNYRNLLNFIDTYPFNVYIMGHSCGKSDRTLLNSIFEHENCKTIKSYYYINENGINDQDDRIMNLYLNFKDKSLFRAKVIDKTNCEPLVN
jgi:hypothetical protein